MQHKTRKNTPVTPKLQIIIVFIIMLFIGNRARTGVRADIEQNLIPSNRMQSQTADIEQKIFIIGDSTVHRHNVSWDNKDCGAENTENTLRGWGDDLSLYLEYPDNEINKSRQGSTAETYRNGPPGTAEDEVFREDSASPAPLNRYWGSTEAMIQASNGGFLLIQFGSSNEASFYYGYWNSATQRFEGGRYSDETDSERIRLTEIDFKAAVTYYVDEARTLNITPLLVTVPVGRTKNADGSHYDGRGVFPGYIRDLAADLNVPLLDLHAKTLHEFDKYSDGQLQVEFGNCVHNPGTENEWMDKGHYEPQGSRKVAGWMKELACTLPDQMLCQQFSTTHDLVIPTISLNGAYRITMMAGTAFVDEGATATDDVDGDITGNITVAGTVNTTVAGLYNITYDVTDSSDNAAMQVVRYVEVVPSVFVHEDAEDGNTADWVVYAGNVGNISNVVDAERGSRVIELDGPNGTDDGFRFGTDWQEREKHVFSWSMNYSEDFSFFISAETTDGYKIFVYQPTDNGNEITHGGARYRFSLGAGAMDGTWQTFTRNLSADLALLDPDNTLISIYRIAVRGSGRLDDIKVMFAEDSVGDTIPPRITLNGEATASAFLDSVYTDAGAAASDNADGNLTAQIEVDNMVNTAVSNTYTVTYRVHDRTGNGAFATRMVEIATLHEDAEDGDTVGWAMYGTTSGASISNLFDSDKNSRVIVLDGNDGLNNGFSFTNLDLDGDFTTSWSMNYSEPFKFFIKVRTATYDPLYIYYAPDSIDLGYEEVNDKYYIHNAIGTEAMSGKWMSFTRDVEADLHRVMPTDTLELIYGFYIRGNGRLDDIITSTRGAYGTFTYDAHTYTIIKTPMAWQTAVDSAQTDGGYLAQISSKTENDEIYSRLYRYINQADYTDTDSSTGGNASYVWLGASDLETEGDWRWMMGNAPFWSGTQNGSAVGGLFSNWGRDAGNQQQHEPDNWNNSQDAAAMAITEWPLGSGTLGQTSQWNDLTDTETLYFIIEMERHQVYLPIIKKCKRSAPHLNPPPEGGGSKFPLPKG